MRKKQKALVIKLGWSETLDAEISRTSSLGDVLRSTVILHELRDFHVTWLVDEKAYQLIEDNPLIDRILIYDLTSVLQLESEHFDVVLNLEKVPGLCALADRIKARRHFGFAFDPKSGEAISHDGCEQVYALCKDTFRKRTHQEPWQKILLEMMGGKWSGQEYVLGYKPRSTEQFDFGLNHVVGPKWPTKSWPREHWEKLAKQLTDRGFTVSWQEGLADLRDYMEWLHSCRTIITTDSLGLHLALAMKKPVLALYGPTNATETYLYNLGTAIRPEGFACAPCLSPTCSNSKFCMAETKPEQVLKAALELMRRHSPAPAAALS